MLISQEGVRLVHHRCHYPLRVKVLSCLEWGNVVVVEYRDRCEGCLDLPLYHCPRCGKELHLWWDENNKPFDGEVQVDG